MCGGSPKIEPAKAPPPPAPPPPPPAEITPLQPAIEQGKAEDSKRKGRASLRIDRAASVPGGASGLNIPI